MNAKVAGTLLAVTALAACSAPVQAAAKPAAPAPQQQVVPAAAGQVTAPQVAAPVGELQEIEITQIGSAFSPSRVTVPVGAGVRFLIRNEDPEDHNIVSLDPQLVFPQNQQRPGGTFAIEWVAPKVPGEYRAICAFHSPAMGFKVVVR